MQEYQDNDEDQNNCFEEGVINRRDGLVDENGRVVDDAVFHTFGKRLRKPLHGFLDGVRGLERIGARQLENREGDGRLAVQVAVDVVVLCAQLNAVCRSDDFLELDDYPVFTLEDDFAELFRRHQARRRGQRILEILPRGNRGLTDASGFPKMWAASGVSLPKVIDRLIQLALENHQEKSRNETSI